LPRSWRARIFGRPDGYIPGKSSNWLKKEEGVSTNPELEAELSSNMEELREAGVGSEAERLAEILENPDAAVPAGGAPVEISDAAQQRTDDVIAPAEEARAAFAKAGDMKETEPPSGAA
jgi:hypothetical protein